MAAKIGQGRWSRTQLDRYPAKMTGALAERLVDQYAKEATSILDPFCGSGAVLSAAVRRNIPSFGIDINPYAILLTRVKLEGFDGELAVEFGKEIAGRAAACLDRLVLPDANMGYWFNRQTVNGLERLRYQLSAAGTWESAEGRALLLALALSVRPCSLADQRSPKPFISKVSRSRQIGHPVDVNRRFHYTLAELTRLYGFRSNITSRVLQGDMGEPLPSTILGLHSHVITSPPYINAQDYYRSSMLELNVLAGLVPFEPTIAGKFIGTERGLQGSEPLRAKLNAKKVRIPGLDSLSGHARRLDRVVQQYFLRMDEAITNISGSLRRDGVFVLVCGDNLVGGVRIETWRILSKMAESAGFKLVDRFGDNIACRSLAPKRAGHRGLIKTETVSTFIFCG